MLQRNECFLKVGCKRKYLKFSANSLNQTLLEQLDIMDRNSKEVKLLNSLFKKLYIGRSLCEQIRCLQNGNLKCL